MHKIGFYFIFFSEKYVNVQVSTRSQSDTDVKYNHNKMWSRDFMLLANSSPKTGWSQSVGSIHKAGRKFRILSKLNSSLKPRSKNLCLVSDLHAFSLPYYIDSLHSYYIHPPHLIHIVPTPITCGLPILLSTQRPMYHPPSNMHETQESGRTEVRSSTSAKDGCQTRRLALMLPNGSRLPHSQPKQHKEKHQNSHYTFMHSQQRHGQPLSASALDPAMQISPCRTLPSLEVLLLLFQLLPASWWLWMDAEPNWPRQDFRLTFTWV